MEFKVGDKVFMKGIIRSVDETKDHDMEYFVELEHSFCWTSEDQLLPPEPETCKWEKRPLGYYAHGKFHAPSPNEGGYKYCPYCGRKIEVTR